MYCLEWSGWTDLFHSCKNKASMSANKALETCDKLQIQQQKKYTSTDFHQSLATSMLLPRHNEKWYQRLCPARSRVLKSWEESIPELPLHLIPSLSPTLNLLPRHAFRDVFVAVLAPTDSLFSLIEDRLESLTSCAVV